MPKILNVHQLEGKILELKAAVEKRVSLVADMEVNTYHSYENYENLVTLGGYYECQHL